MSSSSLPQSLESTPTARHSTITLSVTRLDALDHHDVLTDLASCDGVHSRWQSLAGRLASVFEAADSLLALSDHEHSQLRLALTPSDVCLLASAHVVAADAYATRESLVASEFRDHALSLLRLLAVVVPSRLHKITRGDREDSRAEHL